MKLEFIDFVVENGSEDIQLLPGGKALITSVSYEALYSIHTVKELVDEPV